MILYINYASIKTNFLKSYILHVKFVPRRFSRFSHFQLFATLRTVAHQPPMAMGFSRQEYGSGLPCPPPRALADRGMEPTSPLSLVLAGRLFTTSATQEVPATGCRVVAQSCPTLWPHGRQHARLSCPSPSPRACSNSPPLSRWWHSAISSSAVPFSSSPQSFPASGSFLMSWLFASGGQSIVTGYWV